jgi:hypothetical protein
MKSDFTLTTPVRLSPEARFSGHQCTPVSVTGKLYRVTPGYMRPTEFLDMKLQIKRNWLFDYTESCEKQI